MAAGGLTGILLVGGASRRFGSPKALATFDGEALASRAWSTLGSLCDERIAVGKHSDALELPFEILDDGCDVRAPLAGVVAGLRAAKTDMSVVLPVDVPLVRPAELEKLAAACRDAAMPQTGPLPAALRKSALPALERRLDAGELALRDAFAELTTQTVELDAHVLTNVNTRSDLEALRPRIVPFGPRHAAGFRSLVADTLREFGFEPDPALDPDLDDPRRVYERVWIVESLGNVVGTVAMRRVSPQAVELKRMYLRPAMRGRGLGKALLDTALEWARAEGVELVKLDTTEQMQSARSLYDARGFVRVPGDAPRQGRARLLYELRLWPEGPSAKRDD